MHTFFKNLALVICVGAVCVGFPLGVTKIITGNVIQGNALILFVGAIAISMFRLAAYYHKRHIHVNLFGITGAVIAALSGVSFVLVYGLADSITFLTLALITLTLGAHALCEDKFSFMLQKTAIAVAIISVAFLKTTLLLSIGLAITFCLFLLSFFFHVPKKETATKENIADAS